VRSGAGKEDEHLPGLSSALASSARPQMPKRALVATLAAALLAISAGAAMAAADHSAESSHARHRPCRSARSARCLRLARGKEPIIISSAGVISRQEALQAFVQTVGPLPGVKVEPGAVDRSAFVSLSGPIRWAASYLRTLSPAQREAFGKLLSVQPRRSHGVRAYIASSPTAADKQKWEQSAQTSVGLLSQHLGVSLSAAPAFPVVVKLMPGVDPTDPVAEADTGGVDQQGNWVSSLGPGVVCRIRVYSVAWKSGNPDTPLADMAHEVAHCFELKLNAGDYSDHTLAWLQEGGAEWAGSQVAKEALGHDPKDKLLHQYWEKYLSSPSVGVFTRTYSAVGFFAHLAETAASGNIWPTLRDMWKATGGNSAAYDLAVPDSNTVFLDSWASGYARDPLLGQGWDTTGVGITATKPQIPLYGGGGTVTINADPRSASIDKVLINNEVLEVTNTGGTPFGRLRDAGGTTFDLSPGAYCVQGKDCSCPAGSAGNGNDLPTIAPGAAWVALAANKAASDITLKRTSAATWCNHPTPGGGGSYGRSQLSVGGAATASSYQGGRYDQCTIHQNNPDPPGIYLQCIFEMMEPGGQITLLSFTTERYTGSGYYPADTRGTIWPEVGYADLSGSYTTTDMPCPLGDPDQFCLAHADAGGFTIATDSGRTISGGIGATMENVESPGKADSTAGANGTFSVPLQTAP